MKGRALMIRLGALGDTLQASSAACLLKKHHPGVEVDFLATRGLEDLFRMIPSVSRVYGLPFRGQSFRLHPWWNLIRRRLNRNGYALVYLMETNPRFKSLLDGIRAERKLTVNGPGGPTPVCSGLPNPVRYQRGLWAAGIVPEEVCHPELIVSRDQEERARQLVATQGLDPDGVIVGIHGGNSRRGRGGTWRRRFRTPDLRGWPEERWAELCVEMHLANPGIQIVLFGGPGDKGVSCRIERLARQRCPAISMANAAGRTDLLLAAALLRCFSLFLATDTGPIHMAAAVGVPFVGLYGPTRFLETRPFPAEPVGGVLRGSLPCQPCYGTPDQRTCRDNRCMRQIEVEQVLGKAMQVCPSAFCD